MRTRFTGEGKTSLWKDGSSSRTKEESQWYLNALVEIIGIPSYLNCFSLCVGLDGIRRMSLQPVRHLRTNIFFIIKMPSFYPSNLYGTH